MGSVVIDGVSYETVIIGNQEWMAENLRRTKYNDGMDIPVVEDGTEWSELSTGAMCWFDNVVDDTYGVLYNWYAVNTGKLGQDDWRVPTHEDWITLEEYLIANGYNWDGSLTGNKVAKSLAAKTGFTEPSTVDGAPSNDPSTNNSTGFTGYPAGKRNHTGSFTSRGYHAPYWTSSEGDTVDDRAWYRQIYHRLESLFRFEFYKTYGRWVRLVRDYTADTPFNYTSRGKRTLTYKYPDYITNHSKSQIIRQDVLRREFFRRNYDPEKRTFWP